MAVYNFAFVGLSDVTDYIQAFSLAIKTTALRGYNRRPHAVYMAWADGRPLSDVTPSELLTYYIVKVLANMLEKSSKTIEDLDNKDKTKKRFSPIYIYGAIYCFFVIYIGGMMESNDQVKERLFYLLYVYNLTMIVPMLFFFMYVQKNYRKLSFIAILNIHIIIVFYICYRQCFQPLLFTSNDIITGIIVLIEKNEATSFTLILCAFMYVKYFQYKSSLSTLEFFGKFIFILMMTLICVWYYSEFVSPSNYMLLSRNEITTLSIILSFFPLFLVVFRASVGVLFARAKIYVADNILNFIFTRILPPPGLSNA